MMEGALTGKTGFTGGAGYSYVGALESEEGLLLSRFWEAGGLLIKLINGKMQGRFWSMERPVIITGMYSSRSSHGVCWWKEEKNL